MGGQPLEEPQNLLRSLLMRPCGGLTSPGAPSPPCLTVEFQLALPDPTHVAPSPETFPGLPLPIGFPRAWLIPGLFYPPGPWGERGVEGWPVRGLVEPHVPPGQVGSRLLLEVGVNKRQDKV